MNFDLPPTLYARSNDIDLANDSFGDRTAQALLIMGFGTRMIAWDEACCERLAVRGYCVIRFDNRDIGRSAKLTDAGVPDAITEHAVNRKTKEKPRWTGASPTKRKPSTPMSTSTG